MYAMTEAEIRAKIDELARNEIRISYGKPENPLSVTASRIGGRPAVPADFVWPEYTGEGYDDVTKSRPLSFLAQINLADIAEYDTEGLLPKTGILSFFYEYISSCWGFDPADKGCSRVYYFPEIDVLTLAETPEEMDEEAVIPEHEVKFEQQISVPDPSCISHDIDYDEYWECSAEMGYEPDEWGDVTKLLGYPDVIQNPMENECERVTRGYRCGSPEDYAKIPESEKADILEKAKDWTLLFQMGTIETDDGHYEMMFGDCGHIYFWIKKSDLQSLNFDNVWLILQCG